MTRPRKEEKKKKKEEEEEKKKKEEEEEKKKKKKEEKEEQDEEKEEPEKEEATPTHSMLHSIGNCTSRTKYLADQKATDSGRRTPKLPDMTGNTCN